MKYRRTGILLVLLLVALLAYLAHYLFRAEKEDNPALGVIFYKYRWGLPDMVLADTNRDGKIDVRLSYRGLGSFGAAPHTYWEDRDFDGVFEIKVFVEGSVNEIQIDVDGDGTYDKNLYGEGARSYYKSLSTTGADPR